MTVELDQQILDNINHTAHTSTAWYPGWVTVDDIRAELTIYALENGHRFKKWVDAGDGFRVNLALRSVARIYGATEKAKRSGFEYDDQAWYSPETVWELLPLALDAGWDGLTGENDDAGVASGKPASEGGGLLAMVVDIRRALWPPGQQHRVSWMLHDFDPETDEGLRRLSALVELLGGARPEAPGYRRKAISNEQAIKVTGGQG